jgi:hypothetical protein
MTQQYIEIIQTSPKGVEHASCLELDKETGQLRVIGVLTHCYLFRPKMARDAILLATWAKKFMEKSQDLTLQQHAVAKTLRACRPPVTAGTNVIPDDNARTAWYDMVTACMKGLEVDTKAIREFCDIAGVPGS